MSSSSVPGSPFIHTRNVISHCVMLMKYAIYAYMSFVFFETELSSSYDARSRPLYL